MVQIDFPKDLSHYNGNNISHKALYLLGCHNRTYIHTPNEYVSYGMAYMSTYADPYKTFVQGYNSVLWHRKSQNLRNQLKSHF